MDLSRTATSLATFSRPVAPSSDPAIVSRAAGLNEPPRTSARTGRPPLFVGDQSGCFHCRAVTPYDLELAYRLVYHAYVNAGYITPSNTGLRMRAFEMCPETATFVSKSPSSSVVAVFSVVEDSPDLGLPSESVFKGEIAQLRGENTHLGEFTNLAVAPDFRHTGANGELFRCAFAHTFAVGCTDIVCSVSPKMVPFYKRCGLKQLSAVKNYSTAIEDPVILMHWPEIQNRFTRPPRDRDADYMFCKRFFYDTNPYLARVHLWMKLNEYMFSDDLALSSLFCKCPDVTLDSSIAVRSSLKRRLGPIYDLSRKASQRISSSRRAPPGRSASQSGDILPNSFYNAHYRAKARSTYKPMGHLHPSGKRAFSISAKRFHRDFYSMRYRREYSRRAVLSSLTGVVASTGKETA